MLLKTIGGSGSSGARMKIVELLNVTFGVLLVVPLPENGTLSQVKKSVAKTVCKTTVRYAQKV